MSPSDSTRIDLCCVISDLGPGGSQRVLSHLIEAWHNRYRIALVTLATPNTDFFHLPDTVVRCALGGVSNTKNKWQGIIANIRRLLKLRQQLRYLKPRVVLSFIGPTNSLTVLAAIGLGLRVIISERNDPAKQSFGWWWDQLRRRLYRYASVVTANSQGALETLRAYVPSTKLHWVPNPLVLPQTIGEGLVFEKPTILAVGRLYPQKAYDILLQSFALFKKDFQDWQLVIIGDGPLKDALQKLARTLAISDSVIWYGTVDNPYPFYHAARFFVLASRYEGTPNVLLEAMACGLAVIVTDGSQGPLAYVTDQLTGRVVPAGAIFPLAVAMADLAKDPQLCTQFAKAAKTRVQSHDLGSVLLTWENILAL